MPNHFEVALTVETDVTYVSQVEIFINFTKSATSSLEFPTFVDRILVLVMRLVVPSRPTRRLPRSCVSMLQRTKREHLMA